MYVRSKAAGIKLQYTTVVCSGSSYRTAHNNEQLVEGFLLLIGFILVSGIGKPTLKGRISLHVREVDLFFLGSLFSSRVVKFPILPLPHSVGINAAAS